MDTLKKAFVLPFVVLAMALTFLAPVAHAKPMEDVVSSRLGAVSYWVSASSSDSKAMLLYYVGSGSEAYVTIDHNSIDAQVPFGTTDTGFGSSGSFDLTASAYDTLGELCDAIDLEDDYGCVLLGAKRDDNSLLLRDQSATNGTNNLKAAGGFEVRFGTASATASPAGPNESRILRVGATARVGKSLVLKKCEWNVNGADNGRVYGCSAGTSSSDLGVEQDGMDFPQSQCSDTSELWREVIADDTNEEWDWTSRSGNDGWQFAQDSHVVVSGGNNASVQETTNFLRCLFEERE
jgi:hypothetical protein